MTLELGGLLLGHRLLAVLEEGHALAAPGVAGRVDAQPPGQGRGQLVGGLHGPVARGADPGLLLTPLLGLPAQRGELGAGGRELLGQARDLLLRLLPERVRLSLVSHGATLSSRLPRTVEVPTRGSRT